VLEKVSIAVGAESGMRRLASHRPASYRPASRRIVDDINGVRNSRGETVEGDATKAADNGHVLVDVGVSGSRRLLSNNTLCQLHLEDNFRALQQFRRNISTQTGELDKVQITIHFVSDEPFCDVLKRVLPPLPDLLEKDVMDLAVSCYK